MKSSKFSYIISKECKFKYQNVVAKTLVSLLLGTCLVLLYLKVNFTGRNATVRQRDKRGRPKRKSATEQKSDSELEGPSLFRKLDFSDIMDRFRVCISQTCIHF